MDLFALGFIKHVYNGKEYYLMHPLGVTHDDIKAVLDEMAAEILVEKQKFLERQEQNKKENEVVDAEVVAEIAD